MARNRCTLLALWACVVLSSIFLIQARVLFQSYVAQVGLGVAIGGATGNLFEAWRERALVAHWRILYLDGIHFSIRHGDKADSTLILTVLGVDLEGNKEVLALRVCAEEDKDGWVCLLQDLRRRGATDIDLIVTDGHEGLLAAVSQLFSATSRQRCLVHKQRNVLNAIPRRERALVQAELVGIWDQPSKQEALTQLEAFKAKYSKRYPDRKNSSQKRQTLIVLRGMKRI